ncbi:hypothetical protein BC941DRAFT_415159 [Chlamydoabsidia padenii]|nr:hypothetical protein BC941DRAFT_415159 [Chlamydoabsidia padenii]
MIDNLVDVSVDIIDSIWPTPHHAKVVGTKGFIREILKRSKTTYFMLQLSLFYIFRVKRVVQAKLRLTTNERHYRDDLMCCGRRMFLASLMVASKYIHDKSYRNKAWAEASGLTLAEINASELAFLQMIDYRLYVSKPTFEKWYDMLNQRLKQRKALPTRITTPSPIKKSSVKPTATATTAGKAIMMTNRNDLRKPTVTTVSPTSTSSAATAHYPSPASPCFYHPDLNVPT